jgi:hypothetical protein
MKLKHTMDEALALYAKNYDRLPDNGSSFFDFFKNLEAFGPIGDIEKSHGAAPMKEAIPFSSFVSQGESVSLEEAARRIGCDISDFHGNSHVRLYSFNDFMGWIGMYGFTDTKSIGRIQYNLQLSDGEWSTGNLVECELRLYRWYIEMNPDFMEQDEHYSAKIDFLIKAEQFKIIAGELNVAWDNLDSFSHTKAAEHYPRMDSFDDVVDQVDFWVNHLNTVII